MDNPNITMEEYIQLMADNARGGDQTFNWETATHGKVYCEDLDSFIDFETDFPVIVYNDAPTSNQNVSSEPTVSIRRILGYGYDVSTSCTVLGPSERNDNIGGVKGLKLEQKRCGVNLLDGTCLNCTYGDGKPVTCCGCEGPLKGGFCSFCASRNENSFAYDSNSNYFNNDQNFSDYTPQPQYETYLCKLCGNNSHYGYDCPLRFPLVYEQESCYNQNYNDNYYSHNSPSFLCCDNCGGPHETFRCQLMNQNFYTNSSDFDQIQPPQYYDMHQPPKESVKEFEEQLKTIVISALEGKFQPPQETSVEILQAKDDLMKSMQTFFKKFNRISFGETPKILLLAWEKYFEIQHAKSEDIQDLLHKLLEDLKIISEELAEFINSSSWNCPTFYDVDDDEYTIIYRSSKAITPDLSIEEPTSSDDKSLSDEDVSEDVEIYSNPLFEFDDEYISRDDGIFTPSDDNELLLHHDPSISIISILEGFIDEPPLEENDDLFDLEPKENDWRKILYDAPIDDLITKDKDSLRS
ncbi:hypothetical protein Tco_0289553 [Tanacetum coccineum]